MVSEQPRDRIVETYTQPGPAESWPTQDVVVGVNGIETRRVPAYSRGVSVTETIVPVRNRVQWGPVLAGTAATLTSMLVFSALGLAIGASAFKPGTDLTDWSTRAGDYGIAAALVAFLFGGWIAARSAAVSGTFAGLINGSVAGAVSLMTLVWLSTTGLANLVGFLGANLGNVAAFVGSNPIANATTTSVSFDDVKKGAWITLAVLVATLVAAAIGGWLGHTDRTRLEEAA
jgi:hypothetical protein